MCFKVSGWHGSGITFFWCSCTFFFFLFLTDHWREQTLTIKVAWKTKRPVLFFIWNKVYGTIASFCLPACPPSLCPSPSQSLRGYQWSWRGPEPGNWGAGPEGTPEVAAPCWGSWSRVEGSVWAPWDPGPAGDRWELPPCAAAAEGGALSGSLCRSPG